MSISNFNSFKNSLRRITEYPLVEIEDQFAVNPPKQKISPIVHQTWINQKFGKNHARSINSFRKINQNLSFKIYTDKDISNYMNSHWSKHKIYKIFCNSLIGPLKTDIFRYCILYEQGGYYFDISRGCSIPLTQLHKKNTRFILTYEDTTCFIPPLNKKIYNLKRPFNHILQWGLAFEKNNKFLEMLLQKIVSVYPFYKNKIFENPKLAILNFTGPGMYTHVMRDYISKTSMKHVTELDYKFNNNGIFKLKGSQIRYQIQPSYTYFKNKKICK
tara:strand:- start:296 stop:1114 length:819 start_codon:yes stop_codon:yes gene_type:complete